ncbi:dephospho-CoA kinase [Bifidobacterium thermophilum]|nr:dephospho-CoA kinase [Bifidobacterium thermophilum]
MVIRIGLTGGIAAGKSTVASRLRELGATIIDYDVLARQIVEPGGEALPRIVEAFGPSAVDAAGRLNRAWLAQRVFSGPDRQALERLDTIEHPLIYAKAQQADAEAASRDDTAVIVHDIPLLADVIDDVPFTFDHVVTVEAPQQVRIERMIRTRGMSGTQAKARIDSQSPQAARLAIADIVVDSDTDRASMLAHVDRLYAQWSAQARHDT